MKAVILAGGLGTRLSEETHLKPKPMVEIGGMPILWHIMKIYSYYGVTDFVVLLGYKGYVIKEFFRNYLYHANSFTVDFENNHTSFISKLNEKWRVTLLDTGDNTMTGGRIKQVEDILTDEDSSFFLTYGDGVSDLNINHLKEFHDSNDSIVTMTSAQPEGRFGSLLIDQNDKVISFKEKPKGDGGWINAGFFVCDRKVFDFIDNNSNTIFENEPLENLAKSNNLSTYKHKGFWLPMDSLRDKNILEEMYQKGNAPWVRW